MKRTSAYAIAAILLVTLLWLGYPVNADSGQIDEPTQAESGRGRYQLEVFMHQASLPQGYYILDTHTGELWTGRSAARPIVVSGPLKK